MNDDFIFNETSKLKFIRNYFVGWAWLVVILCVIQIDAIVNKIQFQLFELNIRSSTTTTTTTPSPPSPQPTAVLCQFRNFQLWHFGAIEKLLIFGCAVSTNYSCLQIFKIIRARVYTLSLTVRQFCSSNIHHAHTHTIATHWRNHILYHLYKTHIYYTVAQCTQKTH